MLLGIFVIEVNGQRVKNNLAIWSHWTSPASHYVASFVQFVLNFLLFLAWPFQAVDLNPLKYGKGIECFLGYSTYVLASHFLVLQHRLEKVFWPLTFNNKNVLLLARPSYDVFQLPHIP